MSAAREDFAPVRLLPLTIAALACVLSIRAATLVRALAQPGAGGPAATLVSAGKAMMSSAQAATTAAPAAVPPGSAAPAAPVAQASLAAPASVVAPASLNAPTSGAAQAGPPGTPLAGSAPIPAAAQAEVGESERSVLLDLRHQRDELERKEQLVTQRESMLGVAEARLSARVGELQTLQARLEGLETARREREEANWHGLVKLYETMKPRDAAVIMNDLDGQVLIQVLDRMRESKAAPVLAAMDPARARSATAKLAELRTQSSTLPPGR